MAARLLPAALIAGIAAGPGCRFNLTQPAFTPYTAVQGAGWCIGDLERLAYTRVPAGRTVTVVVGAASSPRLVLALNSSTLPPLRVAVTVPGRGMVVLGAQVGGDGAPTPIPLGSSAALPLGEHPILVTPTPDSMARGWCGSMTRFLRIEAARVPGPSSMAPLGLLPDQPLSFFDDHFVERRIGTVRRVVPPAQVRVANASWPSSPGGRFHPWMKARSGLALDTSTRSLRFGAAVNWGNLTEPTADPLAEHYDCSLDVDDPQARWGCSLSPAPPSRPRTAPTETTPPLPRSAVWPLPSTTVRHYAADVDGPVNVSELAVHFGYDEEIYGNVTLRAISGYPIWQRRGHNNIRETLVLPVDGVAGRPLLHCDSPCAEGESGCVVVPAATLRQICRDPTNCRCDGPNITDIGCANDNFAGSWMLPSSPAGAGTDTEKSPTPTTVSGGGSLSYVYAQGRRVSAFAPHAAGFDNLAKVRRVLVTWCTIDGLSWSQRWWGADDPAPPSQDGRVAEQYGAVPFCADRSGDRTPQMGCRAVQTGRYDGSPLLSFVMPYDAIRQQFWMDLSYSTDGLTFSSVQQEGGAPVIAIPNGDLGSWNGGLLMGAGPPIVVGERTHALLEFAQSGPHFSFVWRTSSADNLTVPAVRAKGESEFFGPLLPTQWQWFAQNGGWAGVAALARGLSIEVGGLEWRTEGLVALRSASNTTAAAPATVTTRPVRLLADGGDTPCTAVIATANCNASRAAATEGAVAFELLDGVRGEPIPGFSGADAARLQPGADAVALPLVFSNGTQELPSLVKTGVRFRVTMYGGNIEVFGISLRCK